MTTIKPYGAWYFFAVDNVDEVNAEYDKMTLPPGKADYYHPDLADRVTVVSGEVDRGSEYVWVVRDGQLTRLESWKVRKAV